MSSDRLGKYIFPVIPGRLSLGIYPDTLTMETACKNMPHIVFFTSREECCYQPYNSDFGPCNIATTVSFCIRTRNLLSDERFKDRKFVHSTTKDEASNTNAAFLLGAYLVLVEGWSPDEAAAPFDCIQPSPFKPFRDATHLTSDFDLSILDCLRGLSLAHSRAWFSLEGFDFERFASQEDSGMSRVCPKFFAFTGPSSERQRPAHKPPAPEDVIPSFIQAGVSAVVRLNEASAYRREVFTDAGIAHRDLFFPDCSLPSVEVTRQFMDTCEQHEVVAVHCLAGLGRTGTLIALWMMSTYGWRAKETIGWLRIARPGSVIGEQQHFLVDVERVMRPSSPPLSRSSSSSPSSASPAFLSSSAERYRATICSEQVTKGLARHRANKSNLRPPIPPRRGSEHRVDAPPLQRRQSNPELQRRQSNPELQRMQSNPEPRRRLSRVCEGAEL
jgi:cell division cycle 14